MARRTCALVGCEELLPKGARKDKMYCSNAHAKRAWDRRRSAEKAQIEGRKWRRRDILSGEPSSVTYLDGSDSAEGRASARRGPGYERFVKAGYAAEVFAERMTSGRAAEELDTSEANVSRWMAAYREDRSDGKAQEAWSGPGEAVEAALEDFETFCRRYWPDDEVTPFQVEWADHITETLNTGGRLLLLAAQRHSKSETLIKYCVWRIARNPDIRIIWISQSQDLAMKAVGYILDILTGNEKLREEVLGPNKEFRPPPRNNMSWTAGEFTVGVRSRAQKSPTMVAIGKGGSLLSRDADLIVCDDLQEHKHIRSPGNRESDVDWFFTDLMSRKMPNTGLAVIGSRQHLQDIYSEILKRADEWTVKVYPVHDPLCTVDEDDHAAHDTSDCMLWPEHYSHAYMQEQRSQQGEAYFQRN
ncbi:MAG: hypothetical protein WD377_01985, partial [Nitriliruptoraceae bacterium]